MAGGSTEPGRRVSDDPGAIRDRMAETRGNLTRTLDAVRGRLFGTRVPALTERENTVAKTSVKSTAKAAKKSVKSAAKAVGSKVSKAAKSAKSAVKGAAKSTKSAVKGAAKKVATKAKKVVNKVAPKTKSGAARMTTATKPKPVAKKRVVKKRPKPRTVVSKVVDKVEGFAGDVLAGAALGAVQGASAVVVKEVADVVGAPEPTQPELPAPTGESQASNQPVVSVGTSM